MAGRLSGMLTGVLTGGSGGDPDGAPDSVWDRVRRNALLRTVLTGTFVLFMLAAAHLFMVVINAAEHAYAAPSPEDGAVARVFSDRPMSEELEAARARARTDADLAAVDAAVDAVAAGRPIVLRTLPVTPFLAWTALGLCLAGLLLLVATRWFKSDAVQSVVGIFGGNLLWTGGIEYGLTLASRELGIGKTVGVVDGQLVAIYGEYVLLKHTWGALLLIAAYLLFLESNRCPLFVWPRKVAPLMRGPLVAGRIGNYGPRSAFQYSTTVWAFYLLLLWAYDERVFGVYSVATHLVLFGSIAGTVYLLVRLHKQTGWGPALRYAIAAICVLWTPVEIFAKWGVLREPWLLLEPGPAVVFFGGLAVGTAALVRAQQRRRKCPFPHEALSGAPAEPQGDPRVVPGGA